MMGRPENIRLSDETSAVVILDQTALPNQTRYLSLTELEDFTDAIKTLKVRGAPAIGICAAFGVYVLAKKLAGLKHDDFLREYTSIGSVLEASRPTAVNLSWALRRMDNVARGNPGLPVPRILELLKEEAEAIQREDAAMCRSIAEHGLSLLWDGCGVLTHCNAGPLATSLYGTALGPMILAQEQGTSIRVFADETRPLLQGARLTAYELDRAGVDVTLICDNMAGVVMGQGKVDMCFVGCDRIARNGDVANKVGTGAVAVLAKHYGIPFYVLGPTSTIDMECLTGSDIVIEERDPEEIRSLYYKEPITPVGVKCYNPAFDVTDHSLISGIITEKGICKPPYEVSLSSLFPTIDGH